MAERGLPATLAPALLLMLASGASALGLQIVWTRAAGIWLGHDAAAVFGTVTAFFAGMALGALVCGRALSRGGDARRWYVASEALIATWAVVLVVVGPAAGAAIAAAAPAQPTPLVQWALAFGGVSLLLLPATAAIGATFPALERLLAQQLPSRSAVAALYAANTAGAVLGVLAAALWLLPQAGARTAAMACAVLNGLCAVAAWRLFAPAADVAPAPAPLPAATPGIATVLLATGLLGIGYEVLVLRALSQVTENTVYTFALLLAVYLVGSALGAAWLDRMQRTGRPTAAWRDRLLIALAASCLIGSASLWALRPARDGLLAILGTGFAAALATETLLGAMAFALPTFCMGALFSVLAQQAAAGGMGLGRALAVNTLGGALAPLVAIVLLLPAVGLKAALLAVVAGYLLLLALPGGPLRWRTPPGWAVAGATAGLAAFAPPLVTLDLPEGGQLVSHREGVLGSVAVVEDGSGTKWLHIDNRAPEGSNATGFADGRQALLPLLLHPQPLRALFLGYGTGVTAGTAARDPALQVDAVELLPEVAAAAAEHFAADDVTPGRTPTVRVADARRFVRAEGPRYDVIVADNFHPARSGSAALYTVEHFIAVRARLAEDGLFCQWLPLHQMDLDTLRSIVVTFMQVHPQAVAVLATNSLQTPVVGLVAWNGAPRGTVGRVRERLAGATPPPQGWGFDDEWALLGSVFAGPDALRRFAAGAALNTDDRPVVATLAPRLTYTGASLPRDRLYALLAASTVLPEELRALAPDPGDAARLAAYLAARDQYLRAGQSVVASRDPAAMLKQVRGPLLAVLATSPDFRPAREPLLRLADALSTTDREAAERLRAEVARAR